ncbi:hypothetical protein JCM11641_005399, partial [Rhodosporidiobolus odoratus]
MAQPNHITEVLDFTAAGFFPLDATEEEITAQTY